MWIILALAASITWGLTYVLNEQVYKKISVITSLGITTLVTSIVMLIVAFAGGFLIRDLGTISKSNRLLALVIGESVALILAELFIGFSITNKNATLAGLIEISYPIFIALFTYLIFRERQVNWGTFIGGLLIFIGVGVVHYFNR